MCIIVHLQNINQSTMTTYLIILPFLAHSFLLYPLPYELLTITVHVSQAYFPNRLCSHNGFTAVYKRHIVNLAHMTNSHNIII